MNARAVACRVPAALAVYFDMRVTGLVKPNVNLCTLAIVLRLDPDLVSTLQ